MGRTSNETKTQYIVRLADNTKKQDEAILEVDSIMEARVIARGLNRYHGNRQGYLFYGVEVRNGSDQDRYPGMITRHCEEDGDPFGEECGKQWLEKFGGEE